MSVLWLVAAMKDVLMRSGGFLNVRFCDGVSSRKSILKDTNTCSRGTLNRAYLGDDLDCPSFRNSFRSDHSNQLRTTVSSTDSTTFQMSYFLKVLVLVAF